ncbi:ATP-binding protein [Roseibium sp.]|uniref:ATP-binding protein n=1 Tax=Roseibium sp. TaxID=1936156 RepID=UPI003D0C04BD
MTRGTGRWHGTIWLRLLLSILTIAAFTWVILAIGVVFFTQARSDFREITEKSIPEIALASELSEYGTRLAVIATEIAAQTQKRDHKSMQEDVEAASRGISTLLNTNLLADTRNTEQIIEAKENLSAKLQSFLQKSRNLQSNNKTLERYQVELRWLQIDIQTEVAARLQDLSFNIDSLSSKMVRSQSRADRVAAAAIMRQETRLREQMQTIGASSATAITFLLQALFVDTAEKLGQLEELNFDALDNLQLMLAEVPQKADTETLLSSLEQLQSFAHDDPGVFAGSRDRIVLQQQALTDLSAAQAAVADLQAALVELGRERRVAALSFANQAAERLRIASLLLAVATVICGVICAGILLFYVRNQIVARLHRLAEALIEIAQGNLSTPIPTRGNDEIARMGAATEIFRSSVVELNKTHESLQKEIEERRRAYDKLKLTQRELVQAGKLAALGQMSAGISHELNQPLAAMKHHLHNLRLLLAKGKSDAVETKVEVVENLADRMSRVIKHLNGIARRSDYAVKDIALTQALEPVVSLFERRLETSSVRLSVTDDAKALAVLADPVLLEQVLINVIGNAIDAIDMKEAGGGHIRVEAELSQTDAIIVISDDGIGLQGQAPAHLTDPFVTTKEVGKGLGLGLTISFNIMQDMGGHLELAENDLGGVTVRLRLPSAAKKKVMEIEHSA